MRLSSFLSAGLGLLLTVSTVVAQEVIVQSSHRPFRPQQYQDCPPSAYPLVPTDPNAKVDPKDPKKDPKVDQMAPADQFAGATETGTQPGASFNPNMFGDLLGISARRNVVFQNGIPVAFANARQTATTTVVGGNVITVAPVDGWAVSGRYQGFKITDTDSPRPTNRVYFIYNGYNDMSGSILGPQNVPTVNVQRQVLGFERTFLGGDASFGVRLPFMQITGGFDGVGQHVVGDLTLISKFAWINDQQTGNVFSTGLILTVPTGGAGSSTILDDGTTAPHSTLIQPWLGWIYNLPRAFVQGFSSVVVPSDSRDPTILFNSVGAGYWLYRGNDRILTGVVPVAELHLNTPLNHRGSEDSIQFADQLNLTMGAYITFPRMTLGGAVGIPLMGPRPFDTEAIATLNFRY